jgi:hypothetical protein
MCSCLWIRATDKDERISVWVREFNLITKKKFSMVRGPIQFIVELAFVGMFSFLGMTLLGSPGLLVGAIVGIWVVFF